MKALEKAAQDREKMPGAQSNPRPLSAAGELSLEALEPRLAATPGEDTSRISVGGNRGGATAGYPGSSSITASRLGRARSSEQLQAATVLGARQPNGKGLPDMIRAHPLFVFGGLAGLFLLGYACYVYVQIAHPGLLINSTPQPVVAAEPQAGLTAVATANEASLKAPVGSAQDRGALPATQTQEPGNSQLVPLRSVFASRVEPASPISQTGAERPKESFSRAPVAAPPFAPPPKSVAIGMTPQADAIPQSTAPNRISISRGDAAAPRVNATVSEAYSALEAGEFDKAQRLYNQVLRSEPAHVDALLGLAAIAQKENRAEDAQRYFAAILDVEPRHALAQSGLIASMGRADPQAAESRLKQLLARDPSPPLYFNLGNLYAEQGLWPQAQQAYFQAHRLEPRNPDYAYNLAVGLEHLSQQKLALGFYRKAIELASVRGSANFDSGKTQGRITQLSAQFE